MLDFAVFKPCLAGLVFLTVVTSERRCLTMTVRTQKLEIFEVVVVVIAIFMLELKHDFLIVPH